jgi:hypothetical protein
MGLGSIFVAHDWVTVVFYPVDLTLVAYQE